MLNELYTYTFNTFLIDIRAQCGILEAMKREKTFAVTYSQSDEHETLGYIFSWYDGEKETFIPVSLHGALALGEHFDSIGYLDMVHIAPTHHEYVELDYRRDRAKRLQSLAKMEEGLPLAD
jgi:hypothetical protein